MLVGKVAEVFAQTLSACVPVSALELKSEVERSLTEFRSAAASNGLLPLDIAEDLTTAFLDLLLSYEQFSKEDQRLIAASVHYFASDDDAVPDTEGVLGLDDDVEVFNYVVSQVGQPERKLDI